MAIRAVLGCGDSSAAEVLEQRATVEPLAIEAADVLESQEAFDALGATGAQEAESLLKVVAVGSGGIRTKDSAPPNLCGRMSMSMLARAMHCGAFGATTLASRESLVNPMGSFDTPCARSYKIAWRAPFMRTARHMSVSVCRAHSGCGGAWSRDWPRGGGAQRQRGESVHSRRPYAHTPVRCCAASSFGNIHVSSTWLRKVRGVASLGLDLAWASSCQVVRLPLVGVALFRYASGRLVHHCAWLAQQRRPFRTRG